MGYEAKYGGDITTKPMTAMDVKRLLSRIANPNEEPDFSLIKTDMDFSRELTQEDAPDAFDNYWQIDIVQEDEDTGAKSYYICLSNSGRYDEDAVRDFFKAITPFTKEGVVEYTGEDDSHWRFEFRNGGWFEDTGRIVYDVDNYKIPI